jgi:hypothetical protein
MDQLRPARTTYLRHKAPGLRNPAKIARLDIVLKPFFLSSE